MIQKSTTIPIRGDKDFKHAIRAVAAAQGLDMCDLVRKAVDAYCGKDLEPHLAFFAAQNGSKNIHSDSYKSDSE